jgi:hypothetical protein
MNISRSGSCKVKASKMILSSINVTEPVFDIEHYQLMILDNLLVMDKNNMPK